jgi:hypothetical protein
VAPADPVVRAAPARARLDRRPHRHDRLSLGVRPRGQGPAGREALLAGKVDVIVAGGNAVAATKRITTVVPIVFPVAIDPVGAGFVANLSHPGGNVTGLSLQGADLAGKRVELLRKVVPGLRRLGIMANFDYAGAGKERAVCEAAARALGLEPVVLGITRAEDIEPALKTQAEIQALYLVIDALVNTNIGRITALALAAGLPTMLGLPDDLEFGGLMAYGPTPAPCSAAPPNSSTRSCAGPSRATFRSSSRRKSPLSSISRLPRPSD